MVKAWYSKNRSVLVMGYEAYWNLTNKIKLEKIGEKRMDNILKALVDPGLY